MDIKERISTRPLFCSIDVETTMNGTEEVGLSNPMHPLNYIVALGVRKETTYSPAKNNIWFRDAAHYSTFTAYISDIAQDYTLCGHNFAFDLLYLYRQGPSIKRDLQSHKIWDTQLAEYILSGQTMKWSSLDDLCKKYGLPVKDDKIKSYFIAGIGADKIPMHELEPYLCGDIENTLTIAIRQYDIARDNGQLALIESQMEALHATVEMRFNGMHVDTDLLDSYTVEVVDDFVKMKLALEARVAGKIDDINSPKQWSEFFFGGTKKVKERVEVGVYKNGNTKYATVVKTVKIAPHVPFKPDPDKISDKTGQVSVDDSVLNAMLLDPLVRLSYPTIEIIERLLKYRTISKQLSTYVQGLSNHIIGDKIHGNLNHTATVTGRLSATNPNIQNISNNPIKKIFTSRFKGGVIIEPDFNQLEIVALAHVTRDKQLIHDIEHNTDIHSALYEDMFHRKPTKEERKPFKSRTFQLIYGAGAKAISKQAGCSLPEASRYIKEHGIEY